MKTYYFETYGCQMNVYDTGLIESLLMQNDCHKTDNPEKASHIFLNTCSVRFHAENKIHNRIMQLRYLVKQKQATLNIIGCMAQVRKTELRKQYPYLNYLIGPEDYPGLPSLIASLCGNTDSSEKVHPVYEKYQPAAGKFASAFVAVMTGCNNFCSYCVVPFARGREISRSPESIVSEIRRLTASGTPEIVLLGQNVNSFNYNDTGFPGLLRDIAVIPDLKRLRFVTSHPKDISDELMEVMAQYPVICPSLHLPVQSGSDKILKAMNRKYDSAHYRNRVDRLRSLIPEISLSTDILVGFPGETEEDFQQTLKLVSDIRFHNAFAFAYSPRPFAKAALNEDDVPRQTKVARLSQLNEIQNRITREILQQQVGQEKEVLIERISKKNHSEYRGQTPENFNVILNAAGHQPGDIVKVRLRELTGITLLGELND